MNFDSIKCFAMTSRGCPSRSYIAKRNMGIMMMIMLMAARLVEPTLLIKKNDGTPMSAASPKQMSCLFVRFKNTLVLTRVRSLGTGIYAAIVDLLP